MATQLETNLNVNTNAGEAVNQFKALKNELKDAIGALAGLEEGTAEFNTQAARVGALRDQVNALNDAIANTSGAPVENLTNSFGLLSQQVGTLDFGGAATSLGQFAGTIRSFSFKDLIGGAKQLIGTFAQLGKALLANPIFLIAGILIAVGAAVFALKDKIGFLGDAFEAVGNVISDAIKIVTDFTDAIGLTTVGIEDKAEKTIAAAKKEQEAVEQRYDKEIAIAGASGKKTEQLEKQKQIAVLQSLKTQLDAIISVGKATGKFTEDQLKAIDEIGKAANKADQEIKVGAAKAAKEAEDEKKKNDDKAKQNAEKNAADNAKLIKQIRDEQIAAIADENTRAITKANEDKKRRDQDIKDSKASADIKNEALKASQIQLNTDLDTIQKSKDEKDKAAKEKADADKAKAAKDAQDLENKNVLAGAELKVAQNQNDLQAQIDLLNTKKEIELQNEALTANERLLIQQNYYNAVNQLREDDAEKQRQANLKKANDDLSVASSVTGSLSSLSDAYFSIKSANLKKGSKEEEENAKKQFKIQKALQLTGAIIDGAKAVVTSLASSPLAIGPIPNPVGIASLAAVIAASVANIAKIASTQYNGANTSASSGGGSTGLGGGVASTDVGSSSSGLSFSQFDPETVGSSGTADGKNKRTGNGEAQRVYVLESDITNTQNKVKTIQSQATIG